MTIRQGLRFSTSLLITASVSATLGTLVAERAGLLERAQAQQTDEQRKDKQKKDKGQQGKKGIAPFLVRELVNFEDPKCVRERRGRPGGDEGRRRKPRSAAPASCKLSRA